MMLMINRPAAQVLKPGFDISACVRTDLQHQPLEQDAFYTARRRRKNGIHTLPLYVLGLTRETHCTLQAARHLLRTSLLSSHYLPGIRATAAHLVSGLRERPFRWRCGNAKCLGSPFVGSPPCLAPSSLGVLSGSESAASGLDSLTRQRAARTPW